MARSDTVRRRSSLTITGGHWRQQGEKLGVSDPKQVMAAFALAYNARDLEALLALYDAHCRVIAPWGERVDDPRGLRHALIRLLEFDGVMQAVHQLSVVNADSALNEGKWILRRGVDSEGRLFDSAVQTYQVLRLDTRRRWRVVVEHSASISAASL